MNLEGTISSQAVNLTPRQVCTRCVMDQSDPDIVFDAAGVCNHCKSYESRKPPLGVAEREAALGVLVERIKASGKGNKYDCIIGLSGGVDSTYVAYKVKTLGLRALAVHFDNGWNSELAVNNIEHIVKRLGFDLYTYVIDWEEFKDLQVAFLRASVPDAEIPTDHAIVGVLLRLAREHGVGYIMSGLNHATEGTLPIRWSYGHADWRYVREVSKRFSKGELRHYPHYGLLRRIYTILLGRPRVVCLLDYEDYDKQKAISVIESELGWRNYGGKHHESIYTRFFQSYILPRKFGIDKRKAHLSCLILSGQIMRQEALAELARPAVSDEIAREDLSYVIKKLGLTAEKFEELMSLPVKSFNDYPTYYPLLNRIAKIVRWAKAKGLIPRAAGM